MLLLGDFLGPGFRTDGDSYYGSSYGSVEIQGEGYSEVTNKVASGEKIIMATRPLARGEDAVVESVVAAAVGSFALRSGVRCSGAAGVEIWLAGVVEIPG